MLEQFSEVLYYARGIIRNRWLIVIFAWLISLVGWLVVFNMPNIYSSSARVHVDTRTMLRPLMVGLAVQSDIRGLVDIMKKLMFTQQNMIKVAELAGMDVDLSSDTKVQELVTRLKDKVKISGGRGEIFSISYESPDRQNAKNVVQAVLEVFSEQTQQSTLSDVDSAKRFIDNQIREYEQRLRNAERAKENFKRENIGLLPDQGGDGQIISIQSIRQQMETLRMQRAELLSKKKVLQQQLTEALESDEEWGLTEIVKPDSIEDARIAVLQQRKSELLLKYTDNHPNILSIDYLIKELQEKSKAKQQDAIVAPTFRAMSSPYVQTIKLSLNQLDTELATIESRLHSLQTKLQKEDEQFNTRLSIETEMQNLNRDYETIKKNYLSLIERREQARLSNSVDTQVDSLKFKIADPANMPLKPSSPNRKLFYTLVLVAGFAVGFVVALLKVILRPSFVESKQLRAVTGLPVLGVISEVVSDHQLKINRYQWVGFLFANVLLLLAYVAMLMSSMAF